MNKNLNKKTLALILAGYFTLSSLVGCSKEANVSTDSEIDTDIILDSSELETETAKPKEEESTFITETTAEMEETLNAALKKDEENKRNASLAESEKAAAALAEAKKNQEKKDKETKDAETISVPESEKTPNDIIISSSEKNKKEEETAAKDNKKKAPVTEAETTKSEGFEVVIDENKKSTPETSPDIIFDNSGATEAPKGDVKYIDTTLGDKAAVKIIDGAKIGYLDPVTKDIFIEVGKYKTIVVDLAKKGRSYTPLGFKKVLYVTTDAGMGFIDALTGAELIKPGLYTLVQYENPEPMKDGKVSENNLPYLDLGTRKLIVCYDKDNNVEFLDAYSFAVAIPKNKYTQVKTLENHLSFEGFSSNVAINLNSLLVSIKNNKYGLIDSLSLEEVLPTVYDSFAFDNETILLKKDGVVGEYKISDIFPVQYLNQQYIDAQKQIQNNNQIQFESETENLNQNDNQIQFESETDNQVPNDNENENGAEFIIGRRR